MANISHVSFWSQAFLYKIPEILLGLVLIILGYLISKKIARLFNKAFEAKSQDALLSTFLSKLLGIASFLLIASVYLPLFCRTSFAFLFLLRSVSNYLFNDNLGKFSVILCRTGSRSVFKNCLIRFL